MVFSNIHSTLHLKHHSFELDYEKLRHQKILHEVKKFITQEGSVSKERYKFYIQDFRIDQEMDSQGRLQENSIVNKIPYLLKPSINIKSGHIKYFDSLHNYSKNEKKDKIFFYGMKQEESKPQKDYGYSKDDAVIFKIGELKKLKELIN